MILKNTKHLYFNPGCALNLYRPGHAEKLFAYLRGSFPQIQMHNICCRHDPNVPEGSVIINVCAGCDRRFRSLYKGVSTISLWEVICELDHFPLPDHHRMEVSIHDPCPVRDNHAVHRAVRALLNKMNLTIIEAEQNRTNSFCCGDSLYPHRSTETIHRAMRRRADSMPCEQVVVYCVSCIKAMHIGGKIPCHLADLLLGEVTDPQECDIGTWHRELDAYIAAH